VNLASVIWRTVHISWRRCCSDRRRRTGRCSTALTFIWQLPNLCIITPPLLGGVITYARHVEGCAAPSISGRNETPSAGGCADGLRAWLTCTCGTPAAGPQRPAASAQLAGVKVNDAGYSGAFGNSCGVVAGAGECRCR